MNAALLKEWNALLARRRKFNANGHDGSDFAAWAKFRGAVLAPLQMELFA